LARLLGGDSGTGKDAPHQKNSKNPAHGIHEFPSFDSNLLKDYSDAWERQAPGL
jgi:hypothetical protein